MRGAINMLKKTKPIVVILIFAVALLALCGGALAKEIIDSGDDSQEAVKPDILEEEALIIDDPPFITILKSKLYCYDYRIVNIRTGEETSSGYTARNFAVQCTYILSPDGFGRRTLQDYPTNKQFTTVSMPGVYTNSYRQPMGRLIGFWSRMGDYSDWKAIDSGTEELMGEMLQYIDYRNIIGRVTRCFLKDGDVYAMWVVRHTDGSSANAVTYVSNATGNPSSSYYTPPQSWEDTTFN